MVTVLFAISEPQAKAHWDVWLVVVAISLVSFWQLFVIIHLGTDVKGPPLRRFVEKTKRRVVSIDTRIRIVSEDVIEENTQAIARV